MKRLLGLKKQILFFVALIWTLLLTILSLFSLSRFPKIKFGFDSSDKLMHAFFYLALVLIWHLYFYVKFKLVLKKSFLFGIAIVAFVYGIVIEVLQDVLPYGRSAEWADILANTLGILIASIIVVVFSGNYKSLKRKN